MWFFKRNKQDTPAADPLPADVLQLTGRHVRMMRGLADNGGDDNELTTMLAMVIRGEDPANRSRRLKVRGLGVAEYIDYVMPVYEQRRHTPPERTAEGYRFEPAHPVEGLPATVEIRRPTGWDIDLVLRGDWVDLAERLSGLSAEQMDSLMLCDFVAITSVMDPLVAGS